MREKKGVLDDAAPKSLQSCLTLCDPRDSSPPGSPVPRILQARTLDWVAISFSNAGKWKVKVKSLSRVQLLGTPWTAAYQAPPSMGFSRHEYWSGVPLPSPWMMLGLLFWATGYTAMPLTDVKNTGETFPERVSEGLHLWLVDFEVHPCYSRKGDPWSLTETVLEYRR